MKKYDLISDGSTNTKFSFIEEESKNALIFSGIDIYGLEPANIISGTKSNTYPFIAFDFQDKDIIIGNYKHSFIIEKERANSKYSFLQFNTNKPIRIQLGTKFRDSQNNFIIDDFNLSYKTGFLNLDVRPSVNGTGVLLSGEATKLPETIVYTTGNQIISGIKIFDNNIQVSGTGIFNGLDLNNIDNLTLSGVNVDIQAANVTLDQNLNVSGDLNVSGIIIGNFNGYTGIFTNIFANNIIYNTGDQTISGIKKFTDNLVIEDNLFQSSQASGYLTGVGYSGNYDGGYFLGKTKLSQNTSRLVDNSFGNVWIAKENNRPWYGISISSDGKYQSAVANNAQIYISSDYGNTWTEKESARYWRSISISSDGKYQSAVAVNAQIYISSDYGNTWIAKENNRNWQSISVSSDGKYQSATFFNGIIYTSSDYGNTWVPKMADLSRTWRGISISSDGKYQTAVVGNNGLIYISSDYGNTWVAKDSNRNWLNVSISSDGKYQTAIVNGGQIYVSIDYGNTWVAKDSNRNWQSISVSSDGKYQSAIFYGGQIYVSIDYGNTWAAKENNRDWYGISISSDGKYQAAVVYNKQIYISKTDELIDGNLYVNNLNFGNNNYISGDYIKLKSAQTLTNILTNSGEALINLRANTTRTILSQTDFYGTSFSYQPGLIEKNNISYYFAQNNSSNADTYNFTTNPTPAAANRVARQIGTTSFFDSTRRIAFTGSATNAANSNIQLGIFNTSTADRQYFRGTSGYGGFYFKSKFAIGEIDSNITGKIRGFVGMAASNSAITSQQLSGRAIDMIGMGFDSGDNNWFFIHNSESTTPCTKVSLGSNYTNLIKSGNFIEFAMYATPNSGIGFYANILNSGNTLETGYYTTTNIPATTTLLGPNLNLSTPDNSGNLEFVINGVYVESFR